MLPLEWISSASGTEDADLKAILLTMHDYSEGHQDVLHSRYMYERVLPGNPFFFLNKIFSFWSLWFLSFKSQRNPGQTFEVPI